MSTSSRRPGFTLIELLIVVVIVGILAGLGASNFQEAKKMANARAMAQDARGLMAAIESYYAREQAYPPQFYSYQSIPSSIRFIRGSKADVGFEPMPSGSSNPQSYEIAVFTTYSGAPSGYPLAICWLLAGDYWNEQPHDECGTTLTPGILACFEFAVQDFASCWQIV